MKTLLIKIKQCHKNKTVKSKFKLLKQLNP